MAHLRAGHDNPWSGAVDWNDRGYGEFTWCMVDRGKYRLNTLPDVIVQDPAYFYWALWSEEFTGDALRQALIVASRARHIVPPKTVGGNARFYFELSRRGRLRGITVGRKPKLSAGKRLVKRRHLDLAIVRQLEQARDAKGIELLQRFMLGTYFNGMQLLNPRRAELFFENDENFELTCKQQHLLPRFGKEARRSP